MRTVVVLVVLVAAACTAGRSIGAGLGSLQADRVQAVEAAVSAAQR